MNNLSADRKFIKSINRTIRIFQFVAAACFGLIYFFSLAKVFMSYQIFICGLCIVAELSLMVAKRNLKEKELEAHPNPSPKV